MGQKRNKDVSELARHLRSIHFALMVICVGLLITFFEAQTDAQRAFEDIRRLRVIENRWNSNPQWLHDNALSRLDNEDIIQSKDTLFASLKVTDIRSVSSIVGVVEEWSASSLTDTLSERTETTALTKSPPFSPILRNFFSNTEDPVSELPRITFWMVIPRGLFTLSPSTPDYWLSDKGSTDLLTSIRLDSLSNMIELWNNFEKEQYIYAVQTLCDSLQIEFTSRSSYLDPAPARLISDVFNPSSTLDIYDPSFLSGQPFVERTLLSNTNGQQSIYLEEKHKDMGFSMLLTCPLLLREWKIIHNDGKYFAETWASIFQRRSVPRPGPGIFPLTSSFGEREERKAIETETVLDTLKFIFRLPVTVEKIPYFGQQELKKIVNPTPDWRQGQFDYTFPDLSALTKGLGSLSLEVLHKVLDNERKREESHVELFGVKIPAILLSKWGMIVVLGLQLYFWLHLLTFKKRIRPNDSAWEIPWIALYSNLQSQVTFFITAFILPIVVCCLVMVRGIHQDSYSVIYFSLGLTISIILSILSGYCFSSMWAASKDSFV